MVAASLIPGSKVVIRKVGLNPSRTGAIKVLKRMGADIKVTSYKLQVTSTEPMGDITVKSSKLRGTVVSRKEIPLLIDELPVLMVAAAYARGRSLFQGVGELRVKETDRIRAMSENLKKMGAVISVRKAGGLEDIVITGVKQLKAAGVKGFRDHRTALSMIIAGLMARGITRIDDISCLNKSFPDFLRFLRKLIH